MVVTEPARARCLSSLPHVREATFVKGGHMTKIRDDGTEKKKWDYALCAKSWYKIPLGSDEPKWEEKYIVLHSVEEDQQNPRRLIVWVYKRAKGATDSYPTLSKRVLQCENEGERDDWVVTFKALLVNHWHERLEESLIPDPEVYQYHSFVQRQGDAQCAPHLFTLSTQALRFVLLRTPTDSDVVMQSDFGSFAKIQRSTEDATLVRLVLTSGQVCACTCADNNTTPTRYRAQR